MSLSFFQSLKKSFFLVGVALVAGQTPGQANAGSVKPIIVNYDPGGVIHRRQAKIEKLRRSGRPVEIKGRCDSACTMYLPLANTCIHPGASFGFHGPHPLKGNYLPQRDFDHWSEVMSDGFREPLKSWFMQTGRHKIKGFYRVKGVKLIEMGYTQCDTRKGQYAHLR
jgi:hypothetical protein